MGDWSLKLIVKSANKTLKKEIRLYYGFSCYYGLTKLPSVMLVTKDDEVYSIGFNNQHNILALPEIEDVNKLFGEPQMVQGLSGIRVRKIVITNLFGAAITVDGKLFFWSADFELKSVRPDIKVLHLACGAHFIVVTTREKDLLVWGYFNKETAGANDFEKIFLPDDVDVQQVSCGWYHVCLLDGKGRVWTFGYGSVGQLGYKWDCSYDVRKPRRVKLPGVCTRVECGALSTVFLLWNGQVYACGQNDRSDYLCVGRQGVVYKPTKVLLNDTITQIASAFCMTPHGWRTLIAAHSQSTKTYYKWGDDARSKTPQAVKDVDEMLDLFDSFCTPRSLIEIPSDPNILSGALIESPSQLLEGKLYDGYVMRSWGIFDDLSDDFINKVDSFRVYQYELYESYEAHDGTHTGAYVITRDDEVYCIGLQQGFKFLVPNAPKSAEHELVPIKVDILSKKNVKTILLGRYQGLALTRGGRLYAWGELEPPELLEISTDQRVKQVVGSLLLNSFCYLTEKNEVYFSTGATEKIITPSKKITSLVSGAFHYAIQTEDFDVYTFSFSQETKWGFLGYDWKTREAQNIAKKVELPGRCKKVVCGFVATNFLMENGDVYGCGIKSGTDEDAIIPQKLTIGEPIKDIDVIWVVGTEGRPMHTAFTGISNTGVVYNWGVGRTDRPEAVRGVSSLIYMYEGIESPQIHLKHGPSERASLEARASADDCTLYSDPLYSDVQLKLHQQEVPAHKTMLHTKSRFFSEKLSSIQANGKVSIDNRPYSETAVKLYLKSLYTGEVDDSNLSLKDLLDLTKLAKTDSNLHLVNDRKIMGRIFETVLQAFTK